MKPLVFLFLISFFLTLTQLQGQSSINRPGQFNLEKGIGISGYDPVAYFKQGKAVKGRKEFSVFAEGITYYFSSEENKEDFKKNFSHYEPQYGGWCAYAMGHDGSKVEVDPETFKIIDGKLYLFYNRLFNNTLKTWNKDEMQLKNNADLNWKKLTNKSNL